jgi:hypothetical protein
MSAINTGRVVAGGLVAGVVMNAVDMASQWCLGDDMAAMVTKLNLDPVVLSDWTKMLPWIAVDLVIGILIVLNYAAMRPRFGPGPKTALMAGFTIYAGITAVMYGFMTMGMFTESFFLKSAGCSAVSTALASLVGGLLYQEK